ncbi:MAG: mono/diheme cytochrome c family protein [Verrucomicrobiales bacterium]|jgi:mono/diheme cytochrome c family protein
MNRCGQSLTRRMSLWQLLVAALAISAMDSTANEPTLEELKTAGALQSSFKNLPAKAVSTEEPQPALGQFREEIAPILKMHCVQCHGPEKSKASLRIDALDPDMLKGKDVDWWTEILGALGNGEMPPPDDSKLSDLDRTRTIDWLSEEIRMASMARRATGGHSSFRRMTRYEYSYALQDLLGIPGDFARDLPPEAHSDDGFQNSSELLHMTVMQLETYRRLAREALLRATVSGPKPPVLYWGVTMENAGKVDWRKQEKRLEEAKAKFKDDPEKLQQELDRLSAESGKPHHPNTYFKNLKSGQTTRHSWDYGSAKYAQTPTESRPDLPIEFDHVAVIPKGENHNLLVELGEKVPDEGIMRVRVRASRNSAAEELIPSMQLEFGWQASNEGRARLRVSAEDTPVAASPDQPEFYQWDVPLGDIYPRNSVRKTSPLGTMPNPSEYIRLVNSSVSRGDIRIEYVEVAAPVYDQWPPESHRRIFFDSASKDEEPVYAREVLTAFMSRALRRTATDEEIDQKLRLFHAIRESCDTFEEAMVEVLATVLSSPDFLYIVRDEIAEGSTSDQLPGLQRLSDHELATRLSMFLWSSVPDDRLLELADRGQLSDPEILPGEVDRMLADSRSKRFSRHFVHQWLDLQLLDFLNSENGPKPLTKEAMQQEPIQFFAEMLRNDESILNFIHADYTMANERLAIHYGLPNVYGNDFRRVKLDSGYRQGGLLTQAGLLAMNSSGEDSNPLKRGIWMLESLLNDPPPPPPPAVPEIDLADPRIAEMTLKERIEDHRNHAACMACHAKIDPWGVAFENYDALGRWRDQIDGKHVDATSRLPNNEILNGMDGLKRFLLKNRQDQFVRAMTHKMTAYALGRPLTFADRSSVEEIAAGVRGQGDGLRTLVIQVTASELFQSK